MTRRLLCRLMLLGIVVAPLGLVGCGESADDQLWGVALGTRAYVPDPSDLPEAQRRAAHRQLANSLGRALDNYPAADDALRRVLQDIRDGEQQLADGQVTGAEADALRQRHEEYWSYLQERELPPDYR